MNEINGFGPLQPLRTTGAPRVFGPAATPEAPAPEYRDEVNLLPAATPEVPVPDYGNEANLRPAATPEAPAPDSRREANLRPEVQAYYTSGGDVKLSRESFKHEVQSFDGFLVANEMRPGAASNLAPKMEFSGLGPIAMLEEPQPEAAGVEFPELSLNGPSTAHEGFYGLSGNRLA